MRTFNRILKIGLAALLMLTLLAGSAFAATKFTDVNAKDETLTKAVSLLEGLGITKGTSETTFGTNEPVTRQQMAAFIYRLMKRGASLEGGENNTPFEDLYDDTYYAMISWANSMGIIKGISATEFDPDGGIILQDAYTMLVRALDYEKKGELAYPFDYINIAEQKNVELGKGLPSSVSYTKELTRGNVAILLYNAFYAETGVSEIVEKERLIGNPEETGVKRKYVLEKVEEYPRLCEKVYDVIEEEFRIYETPHYAFNTAANSTKYKPTEDSQGSGTVLLVATENDQKIESFYTNMEELGLDGNADDLIMSHVKLFYTIDDKKDTVDTVLYAEPLLDKLSANAATYGAYSKERSSDNAEYFYDAKYSYPRMDGSMVVSGKTLWFYGAPYTFAKPTYDGLTTEEERYAARNADNTKLIDLKCLDIDKGLYTWYIKEYSFGDKDSGADKLYSVFTNIRSDGVYSMDIFDPDGDGRYEYMWYKPATFGQILMDDDYEFSSFDEYDSNKPVMIANDKQNTSMDLATKPVIYANGAKLAGESFHDEDFVLAYVNGDANYIEVYASCIAKKGTVTKVSTSAENAIINIGSQAFRTCYQYLYVDNFFVTDSTAYDRSRSTANVNIFSNLISSKALDNEVILYTYNKVYNNVYFYEFLSGGSRTYNGEDLIIPLEDESEASYDDATHKNQQYLKCWVGGEVKYVAIDVEESYPNPKKTADGTYRFDVTVTEDDGREYNVYVDKLCTFDLNSTTGVYTLHSLLHAEDDKGAKDHLDLTYDIDKFADEKKVNQAGTGIATVSKDEGVKFKRKTSNRYELLDANDYSMFGSFGTSASKATWFTDAIVDKDTTIIIRTTTKEKASDEPEYEFVTYTGDKFPGTTETLFKNVQYVYENIEDNTTRAHLLLFYGEVPENEDLEFADGNSTKSADWRIVLAANPAKDSDGKYRWYYDVINPATAKIEEAVPGTSSKSNADALTGAIEAGSAVKVTTSGSISEKADGLIAKIDPETNAALVHITDAGEDNYIEVEPLGEDAEALLTEDGETYGVLEVNDNTTITVLTYKKVSDISTASIAAATYKDLRDAKNAVKAFNDKVEGKNDKLETKYAKYVKAYVTYTKKAKDDYPVADQIVIIVNPDEPVEYLDI